MTHYLGAAPSSAGGAELTAEMWNRQIDAFDVDGLADQVAATGAGYLLFTIGQNSGHYCAPNEAYDNFVAFNPGVRVPVITHTRHEDFAAGEVTLNRLTEAVESCPGRWIERDEARIQFHVLTYLGESWCRGERPQWSDVEVIHVTKQIIEKDGVITYDVPIQKSGLIPQPFVAQLQAVGRAMKGQQP